MSKFVNGYFQVDTQDLDRAIKATGAVHHYVFGGFNHVYTVKPLTEEQQREYEERANKTISECADEMAKAIDAEIVKKLLEERG